MRLLTHDNDGKLVLRVFDNDPLPAYAVLSHTWHPDNSQEVSFQDLEARRAKSKAGYGKIQFCVQQAARDGLQHCWVDTCCIDKSSSAELTEAINSMFDWYRKSAKCYIHLSDIPTFEHTQNEQRVRLSWEDAFHNSRWFTRGWTLQELIAPGSVDFFSKDGEFLGSKATLARQISKITGINIKTLLGEPISDFGVEERFSWVKRRQTTRSEDKAYCLLGIFSVRMRLDYGEGEEAAFSRLRKKIQKLQTWVSH
jgi:hypothetical protein